MTTILITLPSEPSDTIGLPIVGAGDDVVALVPARKLSWHQVQLPKGTLGRGALHDGGNPRLRTVLEGLLEEHLLDEPQNLHFALAPSAHEQVPVLVAVCDRAWLRDALQVLERAGKPANRVIPEFTPDFPADVLYVMGEPDHAHMVFTAPGGVSVWPLSAASVALLDWPAASDIVAEPAVAAQVEQLFQRQVTLQPAGERGVQAMQTNWDLAQFDLVNSSRTRLWKRVGQSLANFASLAHWRPARWALLVLVLINLAGLNVKAWQEKSAIAAKRAAVSEVLVSTFPAVRVVVDAPLQMARAVAGLQQASGVASNSDLESMLGAFAAVAPANTVPGAIEYAAPELRVKGLTATQDELSAMAFKLGAQGYSASVQDDAILIRQGSKP